jgi:hypothetical protein
VRPDSGQPHPRSCSGRPTAIGSRTRRALSRARAVSDGTSSQPGGGLAGRGVRQGWHPPAWFAAVGHSPGGEAAPARDDRRSAALRARRSRRCRPAAGVIRTVAPLIERTGVATAEEIGVETFAQRLRDELQMNSAVHAHPILLSARATTSGA